MSGFAGKCQKHGIDNIEQDAGRGKWVPVCPECEKDRKALLTGAFADSFDSPVGSAWHRGNLE